MVKGVILAFRAASSARDVNCVVFTGDGDKAFCTGGNTKEYAEYYAGTRSEYRQYMRLFNDMVSAILACDKPVICPRQRHAHRWRAGIGMACDFSVAQDPRALRPGRSQARLGADRRRDGLPAADDRQLSARWSRACCASRSPPTRLPVGHARRHRAGAEGRRRIRRQPARRDAALRRRVRPLRLRRAEGRRRREGCEGALARGTIDLSLLDARVEALCAKLC
jgi:6-oxo-cyclohex-1-ene-carbonyl-CoA hydrolase